TAGTAESLVLDFLEAAVGGVSQVSAFLTPKGLNDWVKPGSDETGITIVRLRQPPRGRTEVRCTGVRPCGVPVDVDYTQVGTLDQLGQVEPADSPQSGTMTFWVVQSTDRLGQLRIDSLTKFPHGLVLWDQALNNVPSELTLAEPDQTLSTRYYRQQATYFWHTAT